VSVDNVALRAARPRFAALDNSKLASVGIVMPHWRDALDRYIARR
jgi:dTDP-4-dehydrorhamnose reductase